MLFRSDEADPSGAHHRHQLVEGGRVVVGGPDDVDQALVAELLQPVQSGWPGDQVVDLVQLDPAVGVVQ